MTDWTLIDPPAVRQIARWWAEKYVRESEDVAHSAMRWEADDVEQECLMLIASTPDLMQFARGEEYGLLHARLGQVLWHRLMRPMEDRGYGGLFYRVPDPDHPGKFMTEEKYKSIPFVEDAEADDSEALNSLTMSASSVSLHDNTGHYNTELIQELLPAVWDDSYAYGMPDSELDPERGMPRPRGNKARTNTHWAYVADIRSSWKRAPLTLKERRALFLKHAMNWTLDDIAVNQGSDKGTISKRIATAETRLVAYLNGDYWINNDELENTLD